MSDYHVDAVRRHWNPQTEPFTGLDSLFHAIRNDWCVSQTVFCEHYINSRNRCVRVYTFIVSSGEDIRYMSVIETPHISTFIHRANLDLVYIGKDLPVMSNQPVYASIR